MGNHVFAHDLLAALGRPVHRLDDERLTDGKPAWAAAGTWMLADQIRDLVVLRADRLTAGIWARLLRLRRQTGHRLTLVCHRPEIPAPHAAALTDTEHQVLHDLSRVLHPHDVRIPPGSGPEPPVAGPDVVDLAPVPVRGVAHYRAEAFRTLDPAAFARFDAVYRHGFDAVCGWLSTPVPEPARRAAGAAGHEQVQSFLAWLVHQSPARRHTVTLLRGAQAGLLAHGLLLTVPAADALLNVLSGPGLNTVPLTTHLIDRIRTGVLHPMIAAALATTMFTGVTPRALLYSQLPPENDALRVICRPTRPRVSTAVTVTAPDSVTTAIFHIPPVVRPLLTAAQHFAEHTAAKPWLRPFMAAVVTTEKVAAAAADCRITLPGQPADLAAARQIRPTCAPIDAPAPHTHSHHEGRDDALARTAATESESRGRGHSPDKPAEPDDGHSHGRRPLTTDSATGVLQLIADQVNAVPARSRSARNPARSWLLIRPQLAFYPRDSNGQVTDGLTPHPDVLFALRMVSSPSQTTVPERRFAIHQDQ